jgi:hypothetical protein
MSDDFTNASFSESIVQVRADTSAFARDVALMRAELEGPLAQGAARAGRMIEGALVRAIRTGNLGFEDLRRFALSVMADIAASAIRAGLNQLSGGGAQQNGGGGTSSTGGGGLIDLGLGLASILLGSPGRAHGGGVSAGRSYMVGERGPELFVPGTTGRIEPLGRGSASGRDIRISVTMQGSGQPDRVRMAQTGKQLARALRSALAEDS